VERCEFTIVEATDLYEQDAPDEDQDTLESRLIIRLHCKHGRHGTLSTRPVLQVCSIGIVKTHRLPLLIPTSLLSPGVPDSENESRLTIGPRAIKDITEHFPNARGAKSDPQLVWTFGDTDVEVKSLESSIDTRGGRAWGQIVDF
jgi:cell cycle checkpoint control protein RAD9A